MVYYCLLLGALAVAGLGVWVQQRSPRLGQSMLVLGVLGCVACLGWRVRQTVFSPEEAGPDRGQAVVGYFLAEQVLADMGNQQGSVVLIFPPESVFDADTVGAYAGTFARVLRGFPNLRIEIVTLDLPTRAAKAGNMTVAAFEHAMAKVNLPIAAYVSFTGVPADVEKFTTSGAKTEPSFFVFDPWGTTNWLGALKNGRVRTVIVPRPGPDRAETRNISGEPQEVFKRLYLMGTPSTAEQLIKEMGP